MYLRSCSLRTQFKLKANEKTTSALKAGDGDRALTSILDKKEGIYGACYAPDMSNPNYHRHLFYSSNQGRDDLLWRKGPVLNNVDCWMEIINMQDKVDRKVEDFDVEIHSLKQKREKVIQDYQRSIKLMEQTLSEVRSQFPIQDLQSLVTELKVF